MRNKDANGEYVFIILRYNPENNDGILVDIVTDEEEARRRRDILNKEEGYAVDDVENNDDAIYFTVEQCYVNRKFMYDKENNND